MDRLDVMALFARVVETGSFSRAAEECGIGQPTASKQVAALERRLGVRLLERSTRRLRATEAGQEYYQGCRRMLDEVDDIETRVGAGVQAMAGRIRVACPMAFGRLYVAPVVIGFMAAYPRATVDLVMDDRYVDLVEQGADLSIRIANLEPDSLLHARRLGDGPRAIVGAPSYLRRHGAPREPEDLARHAFSVYANFQDPESLRLRRGDELREARIRATLRVNNAEVMLSAARAGLGLSVLPLWCAAEDLQRGTLRRVLPQWQPPASGIWAVYASARHQPLRVRSFLDYLARRLALPG
jgi:DNA-binding transcriptional LysR family regulator